MLAAKRLAKALQQARSELLRDAISELGSVEWKESSHHRYSVLNMHPLCEVTFTSLFLRHNASPIKLRLPVGDIQQTTSNPTGLPALCWRAFRLAKTGTLHESSCPTPRTSRRVGISDSRSPHSNSWIAPTRSWNFSLVGNERKKYC